MKSKDNEQLVIEYGQEIGLSMEELEEIVTGFIARREASLKSDEIDRSIDAISMYDKETLFVGAVVYSSLINMFLAMEEEKNK